MKLIRSQSYQAPYFQEAGLARQSFAILAQFCLFMRIYQDNLGRRGMLLLSWGVSTLGAIGFNSSFSVWPMVAFNFIIGFGLNVILNEMSDDKFRQKSTIGLLVVFGATEIFCALIFWAITDWRVLYFCFMTMTAILGLMLSYFVAETPKFYLSMGKNKEALAALNRIGSANKRKQLPMETELLLTAPTNRADLQEQSFRRTSLTFSSLVEIKDKRYGYQHLLIFKSLRANTLGLIGMMFSLQLIYYGGQYGLNQISSGTALYEIGALVGMTELTSYIIINAIIEKLPRRKTIMITIGSSILACALFFFFGVSYDSIEIPSDCPVCAQKIIIIFMACLIRLMVSVGFAVEPLYANEIYPTKIRTMGSGFVFSFGLLGGFASPYIFDFAKMLNINPYFLLSIFAFIGPIGTYFVRETQGQPLEDEISEVLDQQIK